MFHKKNYNSKENYPNDINEVNEIQKDSQKELLDIQEQPTPFEKSLPKKNNSPHSTRPVKGSKQNTPAELRDEFIECKKKYNKNYEKFINIKTKIIIFRKELLKICDALYLQMCISPLQDIQMLGMDDITLKKFLFRMGKVPRKDLKILESFLINKKNSDFTVFVKLDDKGNQQTNPVPKNLIDIDKLFQTSNLLSLENEILDNGLYSSLDSDDLSQYVVEEFASFIKKLKSSISEDKNFIKNINKLKQCEMNAVIFLLENIYRDELQRLDILTFRTKGMLEGLEQENSISLNEIFNNNASDNFIDAISDSIDPVLQEVDSIPKSLDQLIEDKNYLLKKMAIAEKEKEVLLAKQEMLAKLEEEKIYLTGQLNAKSEIFRDYKDLQLNTQVIIENMQIYSKRMLHLINTSSAYHSTSGQFALNNGRQKFIPEPKNALTRKLI